MRVFRDVSILRTAGLVSLTLVFTACFTWPDGISPIEPRHGNQIRSDKLVLAWKPVAPEGAERVLYQVAIFGANSDNAVYQVGDLSETSLVVNESLSPGRYRWTVRPFYLRNGNWEAGEWNRRKYMWFAVVLFGFGETLYEFRIADADQPGTARAPGRTRN